MRRREENELARIIRILADAILRLDERVTALEELARLNGELRALRERQ